MISPEQIALAWRDALALWETEVTLSAPEALARKGQGDWGGDEPLAYIDMVARQVVVNYPLLEKIGAARSLTAVYAHELGHHLRFPHTLGLAASLELLQRKLLPAWKESLTNLFFDLQVNEAVGRTRAAELAAVYQGFTRDLPTTSPLFAFYLAIYEELWALPPNALLPRATPATMDTQFPGWRAEARLFAQTFWALTDTYLQFVYFCGCFARYLPESAGQSRRMPFAGDLPQPDLDDYAGALEGNAAIDRALEEGASRGWLEPGAQTGASDPLTDLGRLAGMPGSAVIPFQQALVGRIYQRLVERNLLALPATTLDAPEPFLPTTTVDWEPGDALRSIDWTQSVLSRGAMAGLAPVRRELEPEPPSPESLRGVAVEIYLDTSGSMPHPSAAVNVMTLAAQILSASAIRAGGRVRAVIYSSDADPSEWMLSEEKAREFLLRYSGGGTQFPFPILKESADERSDVIRVVISDSDFLYNVTNGPFSGQGKSRAYQPMPLLLEGVQRSKLFIALLSLPPNSEASARKALAPALALPSFRLAQVSNPVDLPQAAARLARALWDK